MAEFQPSNRPPRPPRGAGRPPRSDSEDGLNRRLDQMEDLADEVSRFSVKGWLPRLRAPRFVRRRLEKLPPEVRYRAQVIWGFVQTIGGLIFITLAVALLFKALTNATLVEPGSAREVLESVDNPSDLAYSVETIRTKQIDGSLLKLETLRGFEVNPGRRHLRALVSGVDLAPYRMVYGDCPQDNPACRGSNGRVWLLQYDGLRPQRITRRMNPDWLRPLYGSDLVPLAGDILDTKATVNGERGWLLSWTPNAAALLRLLSVDLLGIQGKDVQALRAGRFRTEYAAVSVLRNSRRIYQIDVLIRLNGARLRILATYRSQDSGRVDELKLNDERSLEIN